MRGSVLLHYVDHLPLYPYPKFRKSKESHKIQLLLTPKKLSEKKNSGERKRAVIGPWTQTTPDSNSYYHHHQPPQRHHLQSLSHSAASPPSNGGLLHLKPESTTGAGSTSSPLMYTLSVQPCPNSTDGSVRRKRGRPRKYGTPEQAKKATSLSSSAAAVKKREAGGHPPKKSQQLQQQQLSELGQGFTAHIINVTAGEDVYQRIMLFMQQSKRELCILSASGSISNASLRQPATSGGDIMYEGRFELVSLSGSYVRRDNGERSGGLSVCLCDTNSQIIAGGVGGPLVAAGPVQVIVGSFLIVHSKGNDGCTKDMSPASQPASPVACTSMSGGSYRPAVQATERVQSNSNDAQQNIESNPLMIQSRNMHMVPPRAATDWMGGSDARSSGSYEFLSRGGRAPFRSQENGDYNQMGD